MEKNIYDIVSDEIIKLVDDNWNKDQIIRFVYLAIADYLEKNVDFFLNDKLKEYGLNDEEYASVFFDNKTPTVYRGEEKKKQYQVVCKSAATFLKYTFDKLGIESEYVIFTGDEDSIRHWFLVVKGNDDKQYFLTLATDLANIKNNLPTEHFGTEIFNLDSKGQQLYDIPRPTNLKVRKNSKDGIEFEEIEHEILSPEYIRELDESIGYAKLYDLTNLIRKNQNIFVKLYRKLSDEQKEVFRIYRECFDLDSEKHYSEIDKIKVDLFIKRLSIYVLECIDNLSEENKNHEETYKEDLKKALIESISRIGIDTTDFENMSLKDIIKQSNSSIRKLKKDKKLYNSMKVEFDKIDMIQKIDAIENSLFIYSDEYREEVNRRATDLAEKLEVTKDEDERQKLIGEFKQSLIADRKNVGLKKLNPILIDLSVYTEKITSRTKTQDEFLDQDYVYNKFITMFPIVFDCNFENHKTSKSTDFSILGYNEQIDTIKKILSEIFKELEKKNCDKVLGYDVKYNPTQNRIRTFPIFDPATHEYNIGFSFARTPEEPERLLVYYPKENILKKEEIIDISKKYWIASSRFNVEINDNRIPNGKSDLQVMLDDLEKRDLKKEEEKRY